jgi:hypothetical protein
VRALAVDWSGASAFATQRRHIWIASAVDGELTGLSAGRTRSELIAYLVSLLEPDLVVGLDFAFSFPAWWLDRVGASLGPTMWEVTGRSGESWLAACEPPFWGRPGRPRPESLAGDQWRRTETQFPGVRSVFQIGGAGSVGTGSIRGMPHLGVLAEAGAAVWPFDPWPADGTPVVAEVWPRTCIGDVVKTSREARTAFLRGRVAGRLFDVAISCDDAFDAACAALALSRIGAPTVVLDDLDRREGRILSVY